jgi:hypothetical protein
MAQPLFGEDMSKSSIANRRKIAQALMEQATNAGPKAHWLQAVAQAVQGGVGGYEMGQADRADSGRMSAISETAKSLDPNALMQAGIQYEEPALGEMGQFLQRRQEIAAEQERRAAQDIENKRRWEAEHAQRAELAKLRNADTAKYGMQPYHYWETDPKTGKRVLRAAQLNPQGGLGPNLPDPADPLTYRDTGTAQTPAAKYGGAEGAAAAGAAPVPINNEAAAQQRAQGTAAGTFAQDQRNQLAQSEIQLEHTNALIESVINDPAIEYSVGEGVHRLRQFMHPQASIDFYNRLEALDGQALLAQMPMLNAMKPVSNIDAQAATKAALAIDQYKRTSPERTIEALRTFQKLMHDRIGVMRQQAGAPAAPNQNMPLPVQEEPWTDAGEVRIRQRSR